MYLCLDPPRNKQHMELNTCILEGYLRGTIGRDLMEPGKAADYDSCHSPVKKGGRKG